MGLDLTLAPIQYAKGNWWLCNNRMRLDRDFSIFEMIGPAEKAVVFPSSIPDGKRLDWYDDEGLKERKTDPYGTPLTFAAAGAFRKILDNMPPDETWNRAIIAMIASLPPSTPIVIYWS